MRHVLGECMPERSLAKENQPRQGLLFLRAHLPFRLGVQIRRAWRYGHTHDASGVDGPLKRQPVCSIPIMEEALTRLQDAPVHHCSCDFLYE